MRHVYVRILLVGKIERITVYVLVVHQVNQLIQFVEIK